MASNALVQTRIDADVKEKATEVLENMGLTVSGAVRILLTRTANEGMLGTREQQPGLRQLVSREGAPGVGGCPARSR